MTYRDIIATRIATSLRQVYAMTCAGIATILRHDLRHCPDVLLRDDDDV
jgi:hypothetical protein